MALTVLGCATVSDRRERSAPPAAGRGDSTSYVEEGRASYYSSSFAGRRTASGDRYDPNLLTAAHPRLPLGTRVRVTRLGGPSVEVVVNDRCGCTHGRIIDLSHEAARRLGMLSAGVVPVRIEVLRR